MVAILSSSPEPELDGFDPILATLPAVLMPVTSTISFRLIFFSRLAFYGIGNSHGLRLWLSSRNLGLNVLAKRAFAG